MCRNLHTFLAPLMILLMAACNQSSESSHGTYISQPIFVELDNGKLWKANAETTAGIENMQGMIGNFHSTGETDKYHQLAKGLQEEFTLIFQRCTMTGEAHNQLHNYLIPIHDAFPYLESNDEDSCEVGLLRLEHILDLYDQFFE